MILPDTNIWLALAIAGHDHHGPARAWFDSIDEPRSVRFCRATQRGLLRLLTTAAMYAARGETPLSNAEAWRAYQEFTTDDRVGTLMEEPADLEGMWQSLSARDTASPKLWMDAYLAAFAITAGATFVTIDRAFTQFRALDLRLIE